MKTIIIFLSAALMISTSGCDQKIDQAPQSSATRQEAAQHQAKPAEQTMQSKQEAARKTVKAVENIELKDTPVVQKSTEQSLAEVSTLGREKTRSQESKSRTRAQIAEDEMLKDLENFK